MKTISKILICVCCAIALQGRSTTIVGLQNATATFSQTFSDDYSVGRAINGTIADGLGWAIHPQEGQNQIAAFETTANVGFAGGSLLTFTLNQSHVTPGGTYWATSVCLSRLTIEARSAMAFPRAET
jgi:hypothetical protein